MRAMKDSGIKWIGEIPEEWKMCRLKDKCTLKGRIGWKGLRSDEFKEESYAYLITGQDFQKSEIDWNSCYQIEKERYDEDEFIQVSNGDLLITKDGTIGKIAKVSNLTKPATLNSGIFVLKQKRNEYYPNYLYWLLVSPLLVTFNNYMNLGGTTIVHLYQNVFERMPLPFFSFTEQQRIATYLDTKCGEIDELIGIQEKFIEELKAYKQSVITEAVTKGLNPNATLKDSGVEWIGEIPEEWKISRLKFFCTIKSGDAISIDLVKDQGTYPVYGGGEPIGYTTNYNTESNSLIIGRVGARCGCVTFLDENCWATDNALVMLVTLERKYAYYLLIGLDLNKMNTSNAQPLITSTKIKNVNIPLPEFHEQQAIATYLDNKCSQIDSLIALKQTKIDELKSFKKSLIYEYVTGKKTVPETV